MACGTGTVWQIQSTATSANANGGGFDPGDSANFATDLAGTTATGNSPVVSSASYNFVAGDVNAWVYISSGTNWTPGWYQITSVASNQATLSAAAGQAIQRSATIGYPSPKYGSSTVAGCATTASPTGGTWSLDYSQTDSAPFSGTDLASTSGTTNPSVITSSTVTFGVNHVGNVIHITAGTNWTQGWYEIISVSGGAATLDRAVGTSATLSSGTFKVGGAISLGSNTSNQTDNNFFGGSASHINTGGGNRFFIKGSATYTVPTTINGMTAGAATLPHVIEGYASTRGDAPTGSTRPIIAMGTGSFTLGNNTDAYYIITTGTGDPPFQTATSGKMVHVKGVNTSTSAGRRALLTNGTAAAGFFLEGISYRGIGIQNAGGVIYGSYAHDSDIGIVDAATTGVRMLIGNVSESNVTAAIKYSAAATGGTIVLNNTLYGSENTTGTGFLLTTGTTNVRFVNNIVSGFATGLSHPDSQFVAFDDYNDYYNNDSDVSNWQKGSHDIALNPQFFNVGQVTGTAGAFTAGNDRIVDTSKNFTVLGVVANQDYIYIVSGTGVTAGIYAITSIATTTNPNDTLVLSPAPGTNTTADKVYQITTGHNFQIGQNLRSGAYPGVFPGALTTGYMDIGAVQGPPMVPMARVFTGF